MFFDESGVYSGLMCPANFLYLIAFIAAIAVLAAWSSARKEHARVDAMMPGTSGRRGRTVIADGECGGVSYTASFHPGSRHRRRCLRLTVAMAVPYSFSVRREGFFDVFCKRVGISAEVQTGEAAFDRDFYITSDDPLSVGACFSVPEVRRSVARLFDAGFSEVSHDAGGITAAWYGFRPDEGKGQDFVRRAAETLVAITKAAPVEVPVSPRETGWGAWKTRRSFFTGAAVFLAAGGLALWVWGELRYPPLDVSALFSESLKFSLPLLALFLWCATLHLRGRSASHRSLRDIFLIALFGWPFFVFGVMLFANGALDREEAASHEAVVLKKYTTRSRHGTNYHLQVASWREGHAAEALRTNRTFYDAIQPETSRLRIRTRPGALGAEWIESFDLE